MLSGLPVIPEMFVSQSENVRCYIAELENSSFTFAQKRLLSYYENETSLCYYYAYDYQLLVFLPFEEAFNFVQSFTDDVNKIECKSSYRLYKKYYGNSFFQQFDTKDMCDPTYDHLYRHFNLPLLITLIAFGFVGDIYGRKISLITQFLIAAVVEISMLVHSSVWIKLFLRDVAYIFMLGVQWTNYILFVEIVQINFRKYAIGCVRLGYSVGRLLQVSLFEALGRSWHFHHLAVCCVLLLPLQTIWFISESPRWLLWNKKWTDLMEVINQMEYSTSINYLYKPTSRELPKMTPYRLLDVLRKPIFLKKVIYLIIICTILHLCYFNLNLMLIRKLDENSQVTFCIIDIVAGLICVPYLLSTTSRNMSLCCCLFTLSLIYYAIGYLGDKRFVLQLSAIGKCICISANIVAMLLIMEMFPTRVRVLTVYIIEITSMSIAVSLFFANNKYLLAQRYLGGHQYILRSMVILIGVLMCLILTETGDIPLPDTQLEAIFHF